MLLLALIAEQPCHGYDLIRRIEYMFEGAYSPSPGVIYPTLTFLELNAIESIVDLVRAGLGVAILPHLQGGRWAADARLRVVEIPKAEVRRIAFVQTRDSAQAPVVGAVIRELQSRLQG